VKFCELHVLPYFMKYVKLNAFPV